MLDSKPQASTKLKKQAQKRRGAKRSGILRLTGAAQRLADVEKSLDNMARAIEQGIVNLTTKRRMDELTAQKTDLEVRIAREEIQAQILTKDQVKFWLSKMSTLNLAEQDNKQRIIDTFINSIYVHDDRIIVNFNCREGSEVIPLQLNKSSSFLQVLGEQAFRPSQMALLSHCHKDTSIKVTDGTQKN